GIRLERLRRLLRRLRILAVFAVFGVVAAAAALLAATFGRIGADAIVGTTLAAEAALRAATIDERTAPRVARHLVFLDDVDLAARDPAGASGDVHLVPAPLLLDDSHHLAFFDLDDDLSLFAGAVVDLGRLLGLGLFSPG